MLADINVHTLADLQEMGSVFTYRVLKHRFASVSLNMLYGLEAAVRDVHRLSLSQDDKEQLRAAATDELKIDLWWAGGTTTTIPISFLSSFPPSIRISCGNSRSHS